MSLYLPLLRPAIALGLALATCFPAAAQILVGQTAGFSGPVAAGVKETTDGAKLYIDMVNQKGGINGQQVKLISLDDKFVPDLARDNAKKLIEDDKVVALFLTRGTPHTQAMLPEIQKYNVPLIAPSTGAMVLHDPVIPQVFNVRATYQREAEKAITYLASIGVTRIAVVHADDSFGKDALAGAEKGFAAAKLQPAIVIPANRAKPDFASIVPALVKSNAQSVLWIASGKAVTDGVVGLRKTGSSAQVVTLSNNASSGFIEDLGSNGRGVVVTQVFPYEHSIAFPLVKEAQELAKAAHLPEISPAMLEGFAGAKVLVEALRRAGPNPTREKLLQALDGLRYDIGGLEVRYSPTDHTGLDFADLSIIAADGKFRR